MRLVVGMVLAIAASACGRGGFEQRDARLDDGDTDTAAHPLAHVTVAAGWSVAVYVDFSADHTYNPADFMDTTSVLDNQPQALAVLGAPFAEILAVQAGRTIIELSTTRYVEHDYGMHPPNDGDPDNLSRMTLVPDAGGVGPRLVVGSGSENAGDGLFFINSSWSIARDMGLNNVTCFAWDQAGVVQGTPQVFVGTGSGMFRRPDTTTAISFGDFRSIVTIPGGLVFARELAADDVRLVRSTWNGTSFAEAELTMRETIEFADGDRPAGGLAWATTDLEQLVDIALDGTMTEIGMTTEPTFIWEAAAVPPIGHALAPTQRSIYVLETNRPLDIDRVLVFTQQ